MGILTPDQIRELRSYLEEQGLTYESLQTEILDHFCCDVEQYMKQGIEFDEAIKMLQSQIPKGQFKKIQTETMEVLNKKLKPGLVAAYGSFAMLILATFFKLMHWPGAGQILLVSFAGLAITLLLPLFTNPLIRQKDKGRVPLLALSVVVLIFITSIFFQLLHLPGAVFLRQASVLLSIVLLSVYAVYAYINPGKVAEHIIMDYVNKDRVKIERFLMALLILGTSLIIWQNDFIFMVFFMLLFSFGSVFYFIRSWKYYANDQVQPAMKLLCLVVSILAFAMFMAPTMQIIGQSQRIVLVWGAYILVSIIVSLYYFLNSADNQKFVIGFCSLLVAILSTINLVAKTSISNQGLSQSLLEIVYSPLVFMGLIVMFVVFFRRPAFRALMIMTLGVLFVSHQLPGI